MINKKKIKKYFLFFSISIIIVLGAVFFFHTPSGTGGAIQNEGISLNSGQQRIVTIGIGDGAILGNKNAPLTMIEFSDFQCPFCGEFERNVFPLIKKNYIDTGKVKFVFRNFPLVSLHPYALQAAEASECIKKQGGDSGFYKFHDWLFEVQNTVTKTTPGKFSKENLEKESETIGYNITSCLNLGETRNIIYKELKAGTSAGVQGTPTFFIGNKMVVGERSYAYFKNIIDSELTKKK